jgi:hypothetical protein
MIFEGMEERAPRDRCSTAILAVGPTLVSFRG